jgi:hypothetical protein
MFPVEHPVTSPKQVVRMWRHKEFTCDYRQDSEPPHLCIFKGQEVIIEEIVLSKLDAWERAMVLLEIVRTGRLK